MSHVQEIHLLMMVSIPNRNAYKVSAMNYITTAISLIASSINDRIVIVLSHGNVARVIKIIAGNVNTDVAIVQLDKQNLPWVPIAESEPAMNACNGFMPVGLPVGIGLTVGLILAPTLEAALPMSCGGNFAPTGLRHLSSLSSLDVPTQSDGTHALTVAVDNVAAIVVTDPKLQR